MIPTSIPPTGPAQTEGGRRPIEGAAGPPPPDPEVLPRPARRRLTVAYKLQVIQTVSVLRSQGQGAIGAYLRKEGLYYATVRAWERLQAQGRLTTPRRGAKGKNRESLQEEIQALRRKLAQTEKRLAKTELIVELQKKLSAILELETAAHEMPADERGKRDEP